MEPSGVVWALSALGLLNIVQFFYYAIFLLVIGTILFVLAILLKPIIRIIDFELRN